MSNTKIELFKQRVTIDVLKHLTKKTGVLLDSPFILHTKRLVMGLSLSDRYFARAFNLKSYELLVTQISNLVVSAWAHKKRAVNDANPVDLQDYLQKSILPDEKESAQIYNDEISEYINNTKIQIDQFYGLNTFKALVAELFPQTQYKKAYIVLDSKYRDKAEPFTLDDARYKWNYANDSNLRDGFVNSNKKIENIIGIRMLQPVIPKCYVYDTVNRYIRILIEEFAHEAMNDGTVKYHFALGDINTEQSALYNDFNTESYNNGEFKFTRPIRVLDSMTIKVHKASTTAVQSAKHIGITAVNPSSPDLVFFTTDASAHNLTDNDTVIIPGLTFNPAAANDVEAYAAYTDGFYVDVTAADYFEVKDVIAGAYFYSTAVYTATIPKFISFPATDILNLTVTHGSPTTFTTTAVHNLKTGDIISITNFTANNTATDAAAIRSINNATGIAVTYATTTTFTVAVATTVANEKAGLIVKAFVEKCRMSIPLEIVYRPNNDE